jgi:hypothetical protein
MIHDVLIALKTSALDLKDLKISKNKRGIYAFYLAVNSELGGFGNTGDVMYVGISKVCLFSRDLKTHLMSGRTGFSSLRRSLGAVLKDKLDLKAIKRDAAGKRPRWDKFKFDPKSEELLTSWMYENLICGYWTAPIDFTNQQLADLEEEICTCLCPSLDLDRRTIKYNQNAHALLLLRNICVLEAKSPANRNQG